MKSLGSGPRELRKNKPELLQFVRPSLPRYTLEIWGVYAKVNRTELNDEKGMLNFMKEVKGQLYKLITSQEIGC